MSARREKDESFTTLTATVNTNVWNELVGIHDLLNYADTVTGVLVIDKLYVNGRGANAGTNHLLSVRRMWASICDKRGRPYVCAVQGMRSPDKIGVGTKLTRSTQRLRAWWAMAGNAQGVKFILNESTFRALVDTKVAPTIWPSFIDYLKTDDAVRADLKLPPASVIAGLKAVA